MAKTKVMITIDDELLREVDDYCDQNYINRSAFFNQSVSEKVNTQKVVNALSDLATAMKVAAEKGFEDDNFKDKYNTFMAISKVFMPETK